MDLDSGMEPAKYILGISASLDSGPLMRLENNCWQGLLDSCTVVDYGRNTQPRSLFGKGIQLTFDLMATLAAVEFSMVVDGGIIFVGYQTALVPIKTLDGCAQFHLITSNKGQIDPYQCVHGIEERLLTTNPLEFKGMTCFLGWCEVAQINLGTKGLNAKIEYSGAKKKEKSLELNGFTLAALGGAPSNIFTVQAQTTYNFRQHIVHFTPPGNYMKLLLDTSKQLAFIYDSAEKRSWIVPKLSLLHHMAQTYIRYKAGVSDDKIPFVDPYFDASEIVETLFAIGGKNYGNNDQPFLFRNLLIGLNLNLITTTHNLKKSSSNTLNAFECMDIIHESDRGACMKCLKFDRGRGNWIDLVNLVDSVVVCSNLGDAITPSTHTKNRVCSRCDSLPRGCDYLATTGYCLKRLLKQEEKIIEGGSVAYMVSDGVIWNMKGDPFQECCHTDESNSTCWERDNIFQKLCRNRWNYKSLRKDTAPTTGQSILLSTAGIVFS